MGIRMGRRRRRRRRRWWCARNVMMAPCLALVTISGSTQWARGGRGGRGVRGGRGGGEEGSGAVRMGQSP